MLIVVFVVILNIFALWVFCRVGSCHMVAESWLEGGNLPRLNQGEKSGSISRSQHKAGVHRIFNDYCPILDL